jgi:hypothetical protein
MPIFVIQKKQLKLTIMREGTKDSKKRNCRITIILKDEIIIERFYEERIAKDTIENMKKLFPNMFICGALEKKNKRWNVVWTLGNN